MTQNTGLLAVVHRLATDEEFRTRVMIAPRETLATELGISGENYDALVTLLPVLFMGGLLVFGNSASPMPPEDPDWGRWNGR